MPQISLTQSPSYSSSSILREAQERGSLPLGAVARESSGQRFDQAGGVDSRKGVSRSQRSGEQVTLSSVDQLKEMLRQRVVDLHSRSETLVRRIALSGPEQVEALSKELKRLGLELKRLVSQYKALKGMASIASFGAGSQGLSDSMSNLSSLSTLSTASNPVPVPMQGAQAVAAGSMDVSISVVAVDIVDVDAIPSEPLDEKTGQDIEFEGGALESLGREVVELYETLSEGQDSSEKQSERGGESGNNQDGMDALFKEILKKLKEAKGLLEIKARSNGDDDSLELLKSVKLITIDLESELAQFDLSSFSSSPSFASFSP